VFQRRTMIAVAAATTTAKRPNCTYRRYRWGGRYGSTAATTARRASASWSGRAASSVRACPPAVSAASPRVADHGEAAGPESVDRRTGESARTPPDRPTVPNGTPRDRGVTGKGVPGRQDRTLHDLRRDTHHVTPIYRTSTAHHAENGVDRLRDRRRQVNPGRAMERVRR
jgi:hypothetical protein